MATQLGEYCIRCGTLSVMHYDNHGNQIFDCPQGHGTQAIVPFPQDQTPSETGQLNMAMNDTSDTTVALENAATTLTADTQLMIDGEQMTVVDASDPSNLVVVRGVNNTTVVAHAVGAQVQIYGEEQPPVELPPDQGFTGEPPEGEPQPV